MKTLNNLFEETLRDIYYAEKKIARELPKMAAKSNDLDLIRAFERHELETQEHVSRLEQVFDLIGKAPRGKTCPAIDGIVEEAKEIMQEADTNAVRDAGLIAAAQAVEHYEIARYGTLCAWAKELGMIDAANLLHKTLEEEKATDENLTKLASRGGINEHANTKAA